MWPPRHEVDLEALWAPTDPVEAANTLSALGDLYESQGRIEEMARAYKEGIDAIQEREY